MPRGRTPKPLKVLEMSGAVRKNPGRYRARKAAAKSLPPLGPPPAEWLAGAEKNGRLQWLLRIWGEIVAQDTAALRVLNVSHRMLVKNTCMLQYKVERANAGYGKATSGDYAQIEKNLAKMGMTPADSSRVAEAVRVPDRASGSDRPGSSWGEYVG
jgi:hypothetical protein